MENKIVLAYIPVVHQGYLLFLAKHHAASSELWLIDDEITHSFRTLEKDIRALSAQQIKVSLDALHLDWKIKVVGLETLSNTDKKTQFIMPDEEDMHHIAERYFPQALVEYDSVFLRWDRTQSLQQHTPKSDHTVVVSDFLQQIKRHAQELAKQSDDWWRQVGAIIFKDEKILLAGFNQHVPSSQQTAFEGDPRSNFHKGEYIELTTALHAEAHLVAKAAQNGISLLNTEMYVTTFPCPNCAKLIAYCGIKKLYYTEGYSMIDGESILRANQVEIYQVLA